MRVLKEDAWRVPVAETRVQALLRPTHSGFWQFVRFGMVGVVATVVDTAVMLCAYTRLHQSEDISVAAGYSFGLIICYVLSIVWIFPSRNVKDKRVEFAVFMLIGAVGYVLTALVVKVGLMLMGMLSPATTGRMVSAVGELLGVLHVVRSVPANGRFEGAVLLAIAKGLAIVLVFFFNFWSRKVFLFSQRAAK